MGKEHEQSFQFYQPKKVFLPVEIYIWFITPSTSTKQHIDHSKESSKPLPTNLKLNRGVTSSVVFGSQITRNVRHRGGSGNGPVHHLPTFDQLSSQVRRAAVSKLGPGQLAAAHRAALGRRVRLGDQGPPAAVVDEALAQYHFHTSALTTVIAKI